MYTIKGVKMFGNQKSCEFTAEVEVNIKNLPVYEFSDNREDILKRVISELKIGAGYVLCDGGVIGVINDKGFCYLDDMYS